MEKGKGKKREEEDKVKGLEAKSQTETELSYQARIFMIINHNVCVWGGGDALGPKVTY